LYAKLKTTVMNTNSIIEINDLLEELKGYGDNYQSNIGKGERNLSPRCKEIIKTELPSKLIGFFPDDTYKIKGSIGMGRVTKTPWITIIDKNVAKSAQHGVYLVMLFSKNLRKAYFSLAQGVTDSKNDVIAAKREKLRKELNLESAILKHFNDQDIENQEYKNSAIYSNEWNCDDPDYCEKLIEELKNAYKKYVSQEVNVQNTDMDTITDITDDCQKDGFIPIQKIFFGTPGGGKSHKVKTLIEETKKANDRYFRTTFHPDTDYASFVGSYKPIMKGELICYEYVPQVFTLAYIAAWNDPDNEYFLDIEEINRGNCAQIFGDLFQLLDRNKKGYSEFPIQADSDLANYLLNAKDENGNDILSNKDGIEKKKLCLPPNLSIVATMNTSDQSLFPMDSAFKRRWDWEFVPCTFNEKDNYNITIGSKVYKWHTFLKEANARIKQATDSEDKQMGAYFVKTDMDEEKFKSKVMYYLWSEICKEEYKTQNNFFRYIDQENNEQEFTFNELYDEGSTKMLQKFMKFMNVSSDNGDNPDEEGKQEDEE